MASAAALVVPVAAHEHVVEGGTCIRPCDESVLGEIAGTTTTMAFARHEDSLRTTIAKVEFFAKKTARTKIREEQSLLVG